MGNCQAAEVATVVIQHPAGNKVEKLYSSINAKDVMNSNPGHYVALVVSSPNLNSQNGTPFKQFKLLRPDDTLLLGQVYRLITFEDVLKEFASKKCGKLGKLLERSGNGVQMKHKGPNPTASNSDFNSIKVEQEIHQMGSNGSSSSSYNKGFGKHFVVGGGSQWRPALQSIAEVGT
ncbi:hypothetical protein HN51_062096 [Arachis hypogaea]|uniref:DUF4228 domain-containing protein n=1 Tax=Arachis hypogaea TaxID=3818 RepID=A0A445AR39_ARAHY|nr:uncharacterized protein LOC107627895 [Arachis ipaensis]XP_025627392.1 uncharacterized protein LOC112720614 [Arachis hypogaea]QHO19468.1 uncharacterized protein DS421_11g329230 [Arachis hypogaea]RYR28907.1 hypothetical protein Ahy_B01g053124 [Arachis hypogaea]